MTTIETFKLKSNPFRTIPANNPNDIIWAGFDEVKRQMEFTIKNAITSPNSSLVLNWGEYGSGKTHAAKFFQKDDILIELSENHKKPYPILLSFPRGKEPVKELYIGVIDQLEVPKIREQFENLNSLEERINTCSDSTLICNILKLLFEDGVSQNIIKSYLYGTANLAKDGFINNGVQRKIGSDSDYTDFLAALFSILAYNKEIFSCVMLWIDEFEDISTLTNAGINKMNTLIRTLLDKAPNNLLIFMNLTQSAMMDVEDLGGYLQEAVSSRIKSKIELPIPDKDKVKKYLLDLLNNPLYRIENENGYFPFEECVVDKVISDLGASVSLRKYNEVFSALLEIGLQQDRTTIDIDFYNQNKNEIIG